MILMNDFSHLRPLYAAGYVSAPDGRKLEVVNAIDMGEVSFLHSLVSSDETVMNTLEVGCGLGFSAYAICAATRGRGGTHTIVDPFQQALFGKAGIALLEDVGLDNFQLIERGSEFHLPDLAEKAAQFDLVFIDGLHTFDHTMIDLFYANRLLRVGGYLVIDDCNWPVVSRAVHYFSSYPAYEMHSTVDESGWKGAVRRLISLGFEAAPFASGFADRWRLPRMVALRKVAIDNRPSGWQP